MKKSLIALAVAGAMTAPIVAQADATLYGSFRVGLVSQQDEDLDLRDESTRIGIKGDVDLGLDGTKGLFHWEANINTTDQGGYGADMFAPRLSYAGLTGSWGTVLAGRQYHPHYTMVVSHTNIFNSADKEFGEAFALGNNNDKLGYHHKRNDNTLAYASPVMAGFQVVAGAVIAGGNDDSQDDVDGYNVAAQYTGVEGLRVSASYAATEEDGVLGFDQDLWGVGATYKLDALTVAARYEDREIDAAGVTTDERDAWELAAAYQMGATALKARFGDLDIETADVDGEQWGLEVEQKLGNKGRVWVGYTDIDKEVATALGYAEDTLVLGYRLDF